MFTTQKVLKKENKNKKREENKEEKRKERKLKKIKNRFKLNKLILYVYSNSFIYFSLLNKD